VRRRGAEGCRWREVRTGIGDESMKAGWSAGMMLVGNVERAVECVVAIVEISAMKCEVGEEVRKFRKAVSCTDGEVGEIYTCAIYGRKGVRSLR